MIKRSLKKVVPASAINALRSIRYFGFSRYCPVCGGHLRKFLPGGASHRQRPAARCPLCGSLERHRLVWKFFTDMTDLFESDQKSMLHIAPMPGLSRILQNQEHIDYLTADLHDPDVMVRMDIIDIRYPDNSFDVILCSHVLEHVPEDRKAMRELCRVLAPGGWAVLMVPYITDEETYEDPSITDPKERERLFGQHDHVRRYGLDFKDRLEEAGFEVQRYGAEDVADAKDRKKMGLGRTKMGLGEELYYCTKAKAS